MCPTYTFIDRANGKFNTAMGLKKDYAAVFSYAYEIDRAIDNFLSYPEDDSYDILLNLGINPISHSGNSMDDQRALFKRLSDPRTKNGAFKQRFGGDDIP